MCGFEVPLKKIRKLERPKPNSLKHCTKRGANGRKTKWGEEAGLQLRNFVTDRFSYPERPEPLLAHHDRRLRGNSFLGSWRPPCTPGLIYSLEITLAFSREKDGRF